MLDKGKFVELITGMCDIYDKKPSEFIFAIYYDLLKEYEYSLVEKAIKKCLKNRVYSTFPKPAEILEYLEGTKEDKALIAWLTAKKGTEIAGYYETPIFDDPIISHCIVNLGGWLEFSSMKVIDEPFVEKRFIELYRIFMKREVDKPLELTGFLKAQNRLKGLKEYIPESIKIESDDKLRIEGIKRKQLKQKINESIGEKDD